MDVRSTLEFKRTGRRLPSPPSAYKVMDYSDTAPDQRYMEYRKEMNNPAEPTGSTPVPAAGPAQSSHETRSNESKPPSVTTCYFPADMPDAARRPSERLKNKGDKKRPSDHLRSNEPSSKRSKSNNENNGDEKEKEPKKIHPNVQNGLYVAEMFAAHTARQHVISYVVSGKSIGAADLSSN